MRTDCRVQAVIGDEQALDWTACNKVLTHDLRHIIDFDGAIPNGLRVDDNGWAMLALLEASGFVDADAGDKASSLDGVFESGMKLTLAVGGA